MKGFLRKTVGLFVGVAMLLTSVGQVFGSTGRISEIAYSSVVKNRLVNEWEIDAKTVQTQLASNFAPDFESETTWGAITFRVKGKEGNDLNDSAIFILDGRDKDGTYDTKVQQYPVAIFGEMIGMNDETAYPGSINKGTKFENGRWYNVGIVAKKDGTTDYYIDGKFMNSTKHKYMFNDDTAQFSLLVNTTGPEGDKFYIDDISWLKYSDDGFFGEIENNNVSNGGIAKIKFTENVTEFDENEVKVYKCSTGELVSGTEATLESNIISVQIPNDLIEGDEYRIEFETVKGVFGKSPIYDNVYFNCARSLADNEEITVLRETFEGFTKSLTSQHESAGNYYRPEGWYLKERWPGYNKVSIEPGDGGDDYGTSVSFRHASTESNNKGGIYVPLNEDISSGKLTVSFAVNPQTIPSGLREHLFLMVYPTALTEEQMPNNGQDSSKIGDKDYGRIVWMMASEDFAGPNGSDGYNLFGLELEAGAVTNPIWYNIKIEFDFDNDIATWYMNNDKKYEVNNFKSKLAASVAGELSQVSGLSFGVGGNANEESSALIDNLTVTKTLSNTLSEEREIFGDDFNSFENSDQGALKLWDGDETQGILAGYLPKGWAIRNIYPEYDNRKAYTIVHSSSNGVSGNALELGKINGKNESPVVYHKLDKEYTDGVINISYAINGEQLATATDASKRSFYLMTTPLAVDGNGMINDSIAGVGEGWAGDPHENLGKYIFGIQNAEFAAFNTRMFDVDDNGNATPNKVKINGTEYLMEAGYRKEVSLNEWYNIRHTIDLTNKRVKTYIGDDLVYVASTEELDINQIGGVCFAMDWKSGDSKLLIDNVKVTAQDYEMSNGGVMQVRFSDYYNYNYGSATTLTTLADTIAVAFWANTLDTPSENNFSLVDESGNSIPFEGSYLSDENVYIMNLRSYLSKDTSYTLTVDGLTSNGISLPTYTHSIMSEQNGELIIEPLYIMKNGALLENGTLSKGDTITAGTRIINTTGISKSFVFSVGLFENDFLSKFDYREVTLDGISDGVNKEANLSCSYTLSEDDAANFNRIKAFLWDGFTTLKPLVPSKAFTKSE